MVRLDLRDPYMEYIRRWTLSSVKKVNIHCNNPVPPDITELLLKNPSKFYLIFKKSYAFIRFQTTRIVPLSFPDCETLGAVQKI